MQVQSFYKDKAFYLATSVMIGTTIGVGIFGLPYVISKTGFLIGVIELAILGLATILMHLFYAEIILRTQKRHRFIGYTGKYLGKYGKLIASISIIISYSGSLLAYIVVGGLFLDQFFSHWFLFGQTAWSFILFVFCATLIFFGLKLVAKGEVFMTALLLVTITALILKSIPYVRVSHLMTIDISRSFIAYGVILFSLGAFSAVPEVIGILHGRRRFVKHAVSIGIALPLFIYFLFVGAVVGVTGSNTTSEAIAGLNQVFGNEITLLGMVFGFLAVITSFLVIGLNFKENFWYDYKMPHVLAWALAMGIPFTLWLFGANDFIKIIAIVGSISGSLNGILLILMYWKAKRKGDCNPEFSLRFPRWISFFLLGIFFLGVVYEVVFQFFFT